LPFEKIDQLLSARLPDPIEDPELYQIITRFNCHPKTHLSASYSRCNRNESCIWGFPKDLQPSTTLNNHGRVCYKRIMDEDRYVVSYMPFLSKLLDCHVNVDICFTVNIFMYLYKYLFKGPDRTLFNISSDEFHDETADYIDARYLSASEAAWRILEYNISRKEPAVKVLSIHLPNQNLSQMYRTNNGQSAATTLLRYFARSRIPSLETLLYTEYYEKYCLYPIASDASRASAHIRPDDLLEIPDQPFPQQIIRARSRGEVVARIRTVPPRTGELFYLRALLLHKPAYSFECLRLVGNTTHTTFQEAAAALGLFQNSNEAHLALAEAIENYASPHQLRFLFCQLLLYFPTNAITLFDRHQEQLMADYLDQYTSAEVATNLALHDLARYLSTQGSRLADFGLPQPDEQSSLLQLEQASCATQYVNLLEKYQQDQLSLSNEQLDVYYQVLESFYTPSTDRIKTCFFIEGKAGRGKSYTANVIVNRLRCEGHIVLVVGSTALSVTQYERGRTAHSAFGIPVTEVRYSFNKSLLFYYFWILV